MGREKAFFHTLSHPFPSIHPSIHTYASDEAWVGVCLPGEGVCFHLRKPFIIALNIGEKPLSFYDEVMQEGYKKV